MDFSVGDRVTVRNLGGTVRFTGETEFAPGFWIGVELDRPLGKNDGSVQGITYFELGSGRKGQKYGLFSRKEDVHRVDSRESAGALLKVTGDLSESVQLDHLAENMGEKLNAMNAKCEQLEQQLAMAVVEQKKMQLLEQAVETLTLERDEAEQRNDTMISDLEQLTEAHMTALKELNDYKEEVMIRRSADLVLSNEDTGTLDSEALLKHNKLMSIALNKVQSDLQDTERQCETLRCEKNDSDRLCALYSSKIKELERSLSETTASLEDLRLQFHVDNHSNAIIEALTTDNHEMTVELESLKAEVDVMKQNQAANEELELLYKQVEKELTAQIEDLRATLSTDEALINTLKEEIDILHDRLKITNNSLTSPEDRQHPDMDALRTELTTLQLKNSELEFRYSLASVKLEHVDCNEVIDNLSQIKYIYKRNRELCQKCPEVFTTELILLYQYYTVKNRGETGSSFGSIDIDEVLNMLSSGRPAVLNPSEIKATGSFFMTPLIFLQAIHTFLEERVDALLSFYKTRYTESDSADISQLYLSFNELQSAVESKLQDIDAFPGTVLSDVDLSELYYDFIEGISQLAVKDKLLATMQAISDLCFRKEAKSQLLDPEDTLVSNKFEQQVMELKNAVTEKEEIIEELNLKIDVLDSRAERKDELESVAMQLKQEVLSVEDKNKKLRQDLHTLTESYQMLQISLEEEKNRQFSLIDTNASKQIQQLRKEHCEVSLLSELVDLRRIMDAREKNTVIEMSLPTFKGKTDKATNNRTFNDLNNLADILLRGLDIANAPVHSKSPTVRRQKLMNLTEVLESSTSYMKAIINADT